MSDWLSTLECQSIPLAPLGAPATPVRIPQLPREMPFLLPRAEEGHRPVKTLKLGPTTTERRARIVHACDILIAYQIKVLVPTQERKYGRSNI